MKAAVYAGTRNVYQDMIPSMKSLLIHSDVDKVYFLIEDDEFPYELPPEVECINVSDQKWFDAETCPNMKNRCSYMVLLRVVFSKIFPNLDKILTIDNDTIVKSNVSELWDIDLGDNYFAGCTEPFFTKGTITYINMGVAMLNLKKLREDHMDDLLLQNLKTYYYRNAEQGCINDTCQGHILTLPSEYNVTQYTRDKPNTTNTKIQHFAANPKWRTFNIIDYYRNMPIQRNLQDNYDLDFIIPHYNNIEGLRNTLKSTHYRSFPNLHMIVVDDCSTNCDINTLKKEFPGVSFISTDSNGGPGLARQVGMEYGTSSYIMFLDAGDKISSKAAMATVLNTLKNNNDAYIYSFSWYNPEAKHHYYKDMWSCHGSIFKREFLNLYHIQFAVDPAQSYCGEDLSFMQSCYMCLLHCAEEERMKHYFSNKLNLCVYVPDTSSITHTNLYKKAIKGIVYNFYHVMDCAKINNIPMPRVCDHVTRFFVQLYHDYLRCAKNAPELLEYNMKFIREYYYNIYQKFEKINKDTLMHYYQQMMPLLLKQLSERCPRININRFIGEIKND